MEREQGSKLMILWLLIVIFCIACWVIILAALSNAQEPCPTNCERSQKILKYNPMADSKEDEWTYQEQDAIIKYNPTKDVWKYEDIGSTLKYNQFNDEWTYE